RDLPAPILLQRYISMSPPRVVAMAPDGESIVAYDNVASQPSFVPEHALAARFGNNVQVIGFDVPTDVNAGNAVTVRWYWKLLQPTNRELRFFNQVVDESNN